MPFKIFFVSLNFKEFLNNNFSKISEKLRMKKSLHFSPYQIKIDFPWTYPDNTFSSQIRFILRNTPCVISMKLAGISWGDYKTSVWHFYQNEFSLPLFCTHIYVINRIRWQSKLFICRSFNRFFLLPTSHNYPPQVISNSLQISYPTKPLKLNFFKIKINY